MLCYAFLFPIYSSMCCQYCYHYYGIYISCCAVQRNSRLQARQQAPYLFSYLFSYMRFSHCIPSFFLRFFLSFFSFLCPLASVLLSFPVCGERTFHGIKNGRLKGRKRKICKKEGCTCGEAYRPTLYRKCTFCLVTIM